MPLNCSLLYMNFIWTVHILWYVILTSIMEKAEKEIKRLCQSTLPVKFSMTNWNVKHCCPDVKHPNGGQSQQTDSQQRPPRERLQDRAEDSGMMDLDSNKSHLRCPSHTQVETSRQWCEGVQKSGPNVWSWKLPVDVEYQRTKDIRFYHIPWILLPGLFNFMLLPAKQNLRNFYRVKEIHTPSLLSCLWCHKAFLSLTSQKYPSTFYYSFFILMFLPLIIQNSSIRQGLNFLVFLHD